jgi:hypothetical protein
MERFVALVPGVWLAGIVIVELCARQERHA